MRSAALVLPRRTRLRATLSCTSTNSHCLSASCGTATDHDQVRVTLLLALRVQAERNRRSRSCLPSHGPHPGNNGSRRPMWISKFRGGLGGRCVGAVRGRRPSG
jgi:hypothetical protein